MLYSAQVVFDGCECGVQVGKVQGETTCTFANRIWNERKQSETFGYNLLEVRLPAKTMLIT